MMNELFALDTNVLVYLGGNDAAKRKVAETLLSCDPIIPAQVVSEYINVTRRLRSGVTKRQLVAQTADLLRHCPIAPLTQSTLDLAEVLIEKYDFQIFDSIIVASALEAGCSTLYSEDMQHHQLIEGKLKIVNPFL
jgi:predicted nucleic acid-binding protein